MGKELIFVVEESEEGGYVARAIGISIFTDGDTLSELKNNIKEAVICHFDEGKAPKIIKLHFIKEELMAV